MLRVDFGVLGEICAWAGGQAIELGPARQRSVLAVLLAKVNQPVSLDQLTDCVWGESPPQRPTVTLQSYLSRLRTSLPAAWDGGIRRSGGGYLLRADESAVDLHRFLDLRNRARQSDDATAARLYEQALDLWRGEPFADLDTSWAREQRHALQGERLAARLAYHDVRLRRGGHAELLGALESLAAEHPLDERLAAQLILALYRSGRQGEAFRRYERIRKRLAADLGVDPGSDLRLLHHQMLTAGVAPASGETAPAPAPAAAVVVPRQLPAPPPVFVGRPRELATLDAALTGDGTDRVAMISAIGGYGGIGKTWLALYWAHRHVAGFPDGQIYLDLRGFDARNAPMPVETALRLLLGALGAAPAAVPQRQEEQAALYRSLTAGKRLLIVLDNARDTAQVVPLLPGTPSCTVLVTSRNQLPGLIAGHDARHVPLDVLDAAEAHRLLRHHLGSERVEAAPEAVAALVERCAGLPLALSIIAARALMSPRLPLASLAEELREESTRLDALDAGELSADLRTVFAASYRALEPEAARLFRLLALHPGPDIASPAAASLMGADVRRPMAGLVRAHLVTELAPGRFALHDLLRDYAAEQAYADGEAERDAALRRLLDHYLHTAHAAALLFYPNRRAIELTEPPAPGAVRVALRDHQQAAGWLAAESQALLWAVRRAADAGLTTHAWQLAWSLADFLNRQGRWQDILATQQAALEVARDKGDLTAQCRALQTIARTHLRLSRYDDARAHLDLALDLSTRLGDPALQARANHSLTMVFSAQERHGEALAHAERALELYRGLGDKSSTADILNSVGWEHAALGHHREAIDHCEQAVALYESLGDPYGRAAALDSLGYAHHRSGDHDQAVRRYRQAVRLFREAGDHMEEVTCLVNLGDTHRSAGDEAAARQAWRAGLDVLDEIDRPGDDPVRTRLLTRLGLPGDR
ncbi:BTAD domain-containing putative transcriptional regulator [Nonomuraea sp. NPDC050153]|uniref:AfsR/SARP family transcriptional regulator n=1 Tax=Nonomuraea sp. NPDC050153 TaxID=3364359 RepID=UPI003789FFE7